MRDDDSARYVMWFQARDDSINEEVVPLSTGACSAPSRSTGDRGARSPATS